MTLAVLLVAALVAACGGSSDTLEGKKDSSTGSKQAITIGSQDYYSNEIIAEIYAQALEDAGFKVKRDFRIGVREVYIKEIEDGSIDLFPEYTGNLLQYYDKNTKATTSEDVYAALRKALPKGLKVLDQSPATDQDSYNVTKEFAKEYDVASLADLAGVKERLTLGGNSELRTRPYGPKGLKRVYGVDVDFTPIEDNGGPLTIKALKSNDVQLVNVFSADPKIAQSDLVTLADPKGLFLASNVVPVVSSRVTTKMADIIDSVDAALTPEGLVALNSQSVDDKQSAKQIAEQWLKEHDVSA
jgi:osmoprotectant transport system substrate-binding protein